MDTSSNFRAIILEKSQHPEDRELAVKAEEVVKEIIEKLKPILRYVSEPIPFVGSIEKECENPNFTIVNVYQSNSRGVRIMEIEALYTELYTAVGEILFLTERGDFFSVTRCKVTRHKEHYHLKRNAVEAPWKLVPFGELIASLEIVLRYAEEKREQHLQSIRERREKLDEILEILKK